MNKIFFMIVMYLRKNSLLAKIVLSYIIIGAVLLSMLSFVLLKSFSRGSVEEINSVSEKMLAQYYTVANSLFTNTFNYFFGIYDKDLFVFNALYSNIFDPIEVGDINKRLSQEVSLNPLVHSVYIYNAKAGMIFSSMTSVKTREEFFDLEIFSLLNKNKSKPQNIFIPRNTKFALNDKEYDINLISIIFAEYPKTGEPDAALIVNIKQEVIQDMFTAGEEGDGAKVLIVNSEGTIISHPDAQKVNSTIGGQEFFEKIRSSDKNKGHFTTTIDGTLSLATFIKSEKALGWIFISLADYNRLLWRLNTVQKNVVVTTVLFTLLALMTAMLFTSRIYVPLHKLIRKIKSGSGQKEPNTQLNEYDYLNNTFEVLVNDVKQLSTSINLYKPSRKKELLKKLLRNELISLKDTLNELYRIDNNLYSPYYTVCVLRIDSFNEMSKSINMQDLALYRFAISNISEEIFSPVFDIEIVEGDLDHVCAILMLKDSDGENITAKAREAACQIQFALQKYFNFTVTITLGRIVDNLKDIFLSYTNALNYSKYRIIYGKNAFIGFIEMEKFRSRSYEYPLAKEKQLLDALKLEDRNKVNDLLHGIINYVKDFNYDEIILCMTQLALVSARTIESILPEGINNLTADFSDIYRRLGSMDTLDEIRDWFEGLYSSVLSALEARKDSKSDEVIGKLINYIECNYQNPNLTIDLLSDIIGLSPNYVRTIFKGAVNNSVSGYIAELRFRKAQELLLETEYPANRIAEMVGFQSNSYFYINFKKHTGNTPEQYRKLYKQTKTI